jgi:succinate dehydrogenase / fumarate reductase iron-sulfur subunit
MATLSLNFRIWRQASSETRGGFVSYALNHLSTDLSLLEALDQLNEHLILAGEDPIAFEHDCREGICGSCGFWVNGQAHGPLAGTTVCQLYLRHFRDGHTLTLEPWRAQPFPVVKDLVVDRSALDRIVQAGGYCSVNAGSAPEANTLLVARETAKMAFDAAACIGCGACVAACKNASASLFTAAKVAHLSLMPQGQPEGDRRTLAMTQRMQAEGFGSCSNTLECQAACPKEISADWISRMNRQALAAKLHHWLAGPTERLS